MKYLFLLITLMIATPGLAGIQDLLNPISCEDKARRVMDGLIADQKKNPSIYKTKILSNAGTELKVVDKITFLTAQKSIQTFTPLVTATKAIALMNDGDYQIVIIFGNSIPVGLFGLTNCDLKAIYFGVESRATRQIIGGVTVFPQSRDLDPQALATLRYVGAAVLTSGVTPDGKEATPDTPSLYLLQGP